MPDLHFLMRQCIYIYIHKFRVRSTNRLATIHRIVCMCLWFFFFFSIHLRLRLRLSLSFSFQNAIVLFIIYIFGLVIIIINVRLFFSLSFPFFKIEFRKSIETNAFSFSLFYYKNISYYSKQSNDGGPFIVVHYGYIFCCFFLHWI